MPGIFCQEDFVSFPFPGVIRLTDTGLVLIMRHT